jgi:hypothetical protein
MSEKPEERIEEVEDAGEEEPLISSENIPQAREVEDGPQTLDEQLALMSPTDRLDFLEGHLIEQGNWLEAQLEAEEESRYKLCPVCIGTRAIMKATLPLLQGVLERADEKRAIEHEGLVNELVDMLTIAVKFNHANRTALLTMHQCGHEPWRVLKAHPDLKGPTRQRKADPGKKKARKKSRASRRRNK